MTRSERLLRILSVRLWFRIRLFVSWLMGMVGLPGFVRECEYESGIFDAKIRVQVDGIYTIITVNGLDIYFDRFTGKIDGTGGFVNDCTRDAVGGSTLAPDVFGQPRREQSHS